jgi:hypothetical protein
MPLTEKGEKIREAMHEKYGKEKGEEVFYASKNKGTISGVDAMPLTRIDELATKADALAARWDAFVTRRYRKDAFEEARHPRNAGGTFTANEGEEGKEKDDSTDRDELRTGVLSKRT